MIGKAVAVLAGIVLTDLGWYAAAEEVFRGPAKVAGPGLLGVAGRRIVLYGIDAPVPGQHCLADDKPWDCATASATTLLNLVGDREVACEQRRIDRFGRVFAVCKVGDLDVSLTLVEAGMAVALPNETQDYVAAEAAARAKGIGVWRGPFMAPAAYREMRTGHPQER
jgi:endonuclease YncB( thermonuclease family)